MVGGLCIFVVTALLIVIALAVYEGWENHPSYKGINIEAIHLTNDSGTYSFHEGVVAENGKTLSWDDPRVKKITAIAFFYEWMREDPLLGMEGMDSHTLGPAIDNLATYQDKILAKEGSKTDIFPIVFLRAYASSSDAWENFENDTSESNAYALIAAMSVARQAYGQDSGNLLDKIKSIAGSNLQWQFSFMSNDVMTDYGTIIGDLGTIHANAQALHAEIDLREKCLSGDISVCERPMLGGDSEQATAPDPAISRPILPSDILGVDNSFSGPYLAVSPCWDGLSANYFYLKESAIKISGFDSTILESTLATNAFFAVPKSRDPFQQFLANEGVEAFPIEGTNAYDCPDLEFQPNLATVFSFMQQYRNSRIFAALKNEPVYSNGDAETKKIVDGGVAAEAAFFDEKDPSEIMLGNLSDYYAYAYGYGVEHGRDLDNQALLERSLDAKEKMMGYDLLINALAFHLINVNELLTLGKTNAGDSYFYPIRSGYSLTFLVFSPSVWRVSQPLRYLDGETAAKSASQGMFDYDDAVARWGKENLGVWKKLFDEATRPGRVQYYEDLGKEKGL